jgi:plasmid maintenance system antidote protein VapI
MSEVTERIQHALKGRRLDTATVAERMGISDKYLADILSGRLGITAYVALALERVLGLDPHLLMIVQASEELLKARKEREAASHLKVRA